jgi:pimeloyl-ACP methyl ester carboxylesterase
MKTLQTIFRILGWILAILILIFALATFLGKNYGQTAVLILVAVLLVYWPKAIHEKLKPTFSIGIRLLSIVVLIFLMQTVFSSGPKTSIYRSDQHRDKILKSYDTCLEYWPETTRSLHVSTEYGKVHFLECRNTEKPALVLLHAASMGAHSWAENLEPLLDEYHIYSFDNPGEGNRSELSDAMVFPSTPEEVASMYAGIFDSLGIESAVVFGASNGGFIAQNLAYYYPKKVSMLALFCPMGITQLTTGSIALMTLATMYPFQFIRDIVANWALGTAPESHEKYGSWFNAIMKGTFPSIAQPVPMTTTQKQAMDLPVLLFLGTNDRIVGDAETARAMGEIYPNIRIEILESGHLVAVEKRVTVNRILQEFIN